MNAGWGLGFLLAVLAGLCFLVMIIGVMVVVFRAATRGSNRPSSEVGRDDSGNAVFPSVVGADALTNPANPLYQLHQPTTIPGDPSRLHNIDPGPGASFDSGSSAPPVSDPGGSGCG
jgi:hypothetical protein